MTDFLCQVKVKNNVEGMVVDQIVCQFKFFDGTQYIHDKDVNILYGEAGYNDSNTNTKPTRSVGTVIKCIYGGQIFTITDESGDPPPGKCWILIPIEINLETQLALEQPIGLSPEEKLKSRFRIDRA